MPLLIQNVIVKRPQIILGQMFFRRSTPKKLKMIWQVERDGRLSHLVGTAHFFPHSFEGCLRGLLKSSRCAVFEGPLDAESMGRVVRAGTLPDESYHLFEALDAQSIESLTRALSPVCRDRQSFYLFNLRRLSVENPLYEMVRGMKPWLAFFTLWSTYLERCGWRHSVDLEGYRIAVELGLKVVFMETIQEQIQVLEGLSKDRMLAFLKRADHWPKLADAYARSYLRGDLRRLKTMGLKFPSRHSSVIDDRDRCFFERTRDNLTQGGAAVFVGAPHVAGMSRMLQKAGFRVSGPALPE
jgi:uncharacterized protein YbaP (TraB family)